MTYLYAIELIDSDGNYEPSLHHSQADLCDFLKAHENLSIARIMQVEEESLAAFAINDHFYN